MYIEICVMNVISCSTFVWYVCSSVVLIYVLYVIFPLPARAKNSLSTFRIWNKVFIEMTAFDRSNILNSVVEEYKNSNFVWELAFTLMVTIMSDMAIHKSPNMTTGPSVELELVKDECMVSMTADILSTQLLICSWIHSKHPELPHLNHNLFLSPETTKNWKVTEIL